MNASLMFQREWGGSAQGVNRSTWGGTPLLETAHAVGCFIAISLSFLVYSVLQERVMTVGFGKEQELFEWSLFIVFCNRLVTCIISFVLVIVQRKSIYPVAPVPSYAAVSLGNLIASTCQYEGLKYISFPMQTLTKCCKMLPVMLWGSCIGRQRYSAKELVVASIVMAGCAMFIFSGSVLSSAVPNLPSSQYYMMGIGLLLLYLVFDGFTSTWQDKLFQAYEMDTSNQVLYTTLCSTIMSFTVLVCSSDMAKVGSFMNRHPDAWIYVIAVSSVAAIIQYFVSYTIKVYGALTFAALMTARQFLSIIASCIVFKHTFTMGQWLGTLMVFGALGVRISDKHRSANSANSANSRKDGHQPESPRNQHTILAASVHCEQRSSSRRSPSTKGGQMLQVSRWSGTAPERRNSEDHTLATKPVALQTALSSEAVLLAER